MIKCRYFLNLNRKTHLARNQENSECGKPEKAPEIKITAIRCSQIAYEKIIKKHLFSEVLLILY
jgi:hypothetical protein